MSWSKSRNRWRSSAAIALGLAFGAAGTAKGQEVARERLFRETDRALAEAQKVRADLLAPRSFGEGMKRYQESERDLQRGKKAEDVRRKLEDARRHFQRAVEAAQLAYPVLSSVLAARDDAESAAAPAGAESAWLKGEEKLAEAAREMESGDVEGAREKGVEAEALFREAELAAIQASYLDETWDFLRQAEEQKVREWAPVSLSRAQELARRAEQLLAESRYDTDEPRALARQARAEAQHALYLAGIVRAIDDEQLTVEEVILEIEEDFRSIAGRMDFAVSFESGFGETTEAITGRIVDYQERIVRLERELADREEQARGLEARIAELGQQLGGMAEENTALVQRMEEQARLRQRFATVERTFDREEARVLREGGDVIIRLLGLTFPVGESIIDPADHVLLNSVLRAIQEFPGSRVTVEGHTDSFGSDSKNLQLSQERAEAVRRYILDNVRIDPSLIDAIGYGEARPIASNSTKEGRAQNRRTDIVIHTGLGMGY